MKPGSVVLLHSPLLGPAAWGDFPAAVATALGLPVGAILVVDIPAGGEPTFASAYVAHASAQIATATVAAGAAGHPASAFRPPHVLVGYSGSGPLVPQVAFAQRSASRQVGAYVFLDAGLPRPPSGLAASRLELDRLQDPEFAADLERSLLDGATFPSWTDDDLLASLPDKADRETVLAAMRPQGLRYFTELVPNPPDWPDAPCGYLRTSTAYDKAARAAALRGWTCREHEAGHFAALADPSGLAHAFAALVTAL